MTITAGPAVLHCRTREIADPGDLIALLPPGSAPLAWVRAGEGLVAWGSVARFATAGPGRFADAAAAWRSVARRIDVDDEVGVPGTGPVAFASFAFSSDPNPYSGGAGESSVLIVPRVVAGRRGGRCWITELGHVADLPARQGAAVGDPARLGGFPARTGRSSPPRPGPARWIPGAMTPGAYRAAVGEAVSIIESGLLRKVVLARDSVAWFRRPLDQRYLLARLAEAGGAAWTYAVDGLVGATPELLLRRRGPAVESRVLAGTSWPGQDQDAVLAGRKSLDEHRLAVESLQATLGPFCTDLTLDGPHALRLPTVTHLGTDVSGRLDPAHDVSVLDLAGAVHPTAAVGGTPPELAMATIAALEGRAGLRRGRYAGPVGWIDARGDGELGIALRCAAVSGHAARLFAGCGIVSGSDPDLELAETDAKFRAVADALAS